MDSVVGDLTCSVCFNVFFQPVTAPQCQHTFCRRCLDQVIEQAKNSTLFSFSKKFLIEQVLPWLFCFVCVLKRSCPLCRQVFPAGFSVATAPENTDISEQVKTRHPQEHQERAEEWAKEQEELRHILVKNIKLGNEHAAINVSPISVSLPPFTFSMNLH